MRTGIAGYAEIAREARAGRLELSCDLCIIGSGAGGSIVASELAGAGLRVIVIEKGRHVPDEAMTEREFEMAARLYSQDLFAPAEGSGARLPIVRGECLGGGSLVADAICHDPPESLLRSWSKAGLRSWDPSNEALRRLLAEVKEAQSITTVKEETVNRCNQLFRLACKRSGYMTRLVERNLRDGTCHQAGFCVQGCRHGDKQSALNTHIPKAVAAGATFLCECGVERIERRPPSRFRVIATCSDRRLERAEPGAYVAVTINAARVVLAAGAIETPRILLASDPAFDPRKLAGTGLSVHYQTFVVGRIPGVSVRAYEGLPVSVTCEEFASEKAAPGRPVEACGFWMNAALSHPWNLATTFRFYGKPLTEMMDSFESLAGILIYVTAKGRGRVHAGSVHFDVGDDDDRRLVLATQIGAGLMWKIGADRVWTGATQTVLSAPRDTAAIAEGDGYRSRDAFVFTSHPMGGACMGADPGSSLVNEHGESHHAKGLYVADASAFPTPIGAPPYVTVMLHARKVAERMKKG